MFYDEKADYAALLPERLREVTEFSVIEKTVQEQFGQLNEKIKRMSEGRTISDSDTETISRWEKILGVSMPMGAGVQARREALLAKLMTKSPINLEALKNIIETYMGIEVDISVTGYTVTVKYRGESRIANLVPLYNTVYDAIPANMLLRIVYKYINWNELDSIELNFEDLDRKSVDWNRLDKGEWI